MSDDYYREQGRAWALNTISKINPADCIILDTETTGLDNTAEACELAVIDCQGNTLIDTLIKPTRPIPDEVIRIHGISNEHVTSAPTFADLMPEIQRVFSGKTLLIYNSDYDVRILQQSAAEHGLQFDRTLYNTERCIMRIFAAYYGQWNEYKESYKWHKLQAAAHYCNVENEGAHRALADCKMTLGVINYMRKKATERTQKSP
jgi:DNA polymerase III epsilon subunit-like protein